MSKYTSNDPFWSVMEKVATVKNAGIASKLLAWLDRHPKTAAGLGGATGTYLGLEGLDKLLGGSGYATSLITGEKHNPNFLERKGHDIGRFLDRAATLPLYSAARAGNEIALQKFLERNGEIGAYDKAVKDSWRPLYS